MTSGYKAIIFQFIFHLLNQKPRGVNPCIWAASGVHIYTSHHHTTHHHTTQQNRNFSGWVFSFGSWVPA
ncbi:hypothetical protein EYC84_007551 [Monilinia fructicola]|uniref:Uncharacterized protein n=1 Tax=Monilinia fructicola TaxID=38448 RepID=A0A5M9JGX2_MONFR|nr:hypothetical protein EYC84_007551 [Monilinia fructicola]